MVKKISLLIICFILSYSNCYAFNLKNSLQFGTGFFCGLLGHEAAHIIVAKAKGVDVYNLNFNTSHGISFDYRKPSKTIASAGFTEQILSTEIIIHKKLYKKSPFWKGYLTFNIIEPIITTTVNGHCKKHSDLYDYERAGGNRITLGIIINLHSLYTLYRIKKQHKPVNNK